MMANPEKPSGERGQSLIELALTFFILLILLGGVADLGRAFFTFMSMRDAAQEGALFGSVYPLDNGKIEKRIEESSNAPVDFATADIGIAISFPNGNDKKCMGNPIQVDLTYDQFPLIMPFFKVIVGSDTIPIHARIVDEILRPPCQ